ncbi:MAG: hypothetical protein FJ202_05995 [Gemmatimonadetes bacterium]|nr:hypothetical protein [Gemmatimonadota bacterium]
MTREDVKRVAALARIRVADDRVDALVGELEGILGHMRGLQGVELTEAQAAPAVAPLVFETIPESPPEPAPPREPQDPYFVVPRVEGLGSS